MDESVPRSTRKSSKSCVIAYAFDESCSPTSTRRYGVYASASDVKDTGALFCDKHYHMWLMILEWEKSSELVKSGQYYDPDEGWLFHKLNIQTFDSWRRFPVDKLIEASLEPNVTARAVQTFAFYQLEMIVDGSGQSQPKVSRPYDHEARGAQATEDWIRAWMSYGVRLSVLAMLALGDIKGARVIKLPENLENDANQRK